jgi:hypothetical protein
MSKGNVVGIAGMLVLLLASLEGCNKTGSLQVNLSPPGAVNAGAQWRVDGGAWENSGVTVASLSEGTHPVTFKGILGWIAPEAQEC